MAKASPTPLTDEEQETLNSLRQRQAAFLAANAEAQRQLDLSNMAPARAVIELVDTPELTEALDVALMDLKLDFETKQRLQNFRTALRYSIGAIRDKIQGLETATVPPVEGD